MCDSPTYENAQEEITLEELFEHSADGPVLPELDYTDSAAVCEQYDGETVFPVY